MQNLDATYQNLELQKQLAKMQVIGSFQGYLSKVMSLSAAQQVILQKSGLNPVHFDALGANTRNPLLQPAYVDPNTLFGPSLSLLNNSAPQLDSRSFNPPVAHSTNLNTGLGMFGFQNLPTNTLPPVTNQLPALTQSTPIISQPNQLLELPPLPIKKKTDLTDKDDLNDFFQKRVSNASTNVSEDDDEIETGKKMPLEKEIHIKNPGQANQKARKRTKVICGHPWKNHHAKGLCKNCYETYGKTRRPWKCEHQAHFAKGYCKKCYLKLRQKVSVNEIFPFAMNEMKKKSELAKADFEMEDCDIKEETN